MTIKCGLTLGKYAPLHKGHQLVIETATSLMDEVIVMIYDCPAVTAVPLAVRANWLRKIYPKIEVIEAWDGPTEIGNTPEIEKKHSDYILKRLESRKITHFFCSEFYGEHVSRALNAVNYLVDCDRKIIPISGTQIRKDPLASMSFTAMWLLARMRIENWFYWIIVDVIGIGLYYVKGVKFIALLYVILLFMAINGLISWFKKAKMQDF
ncbi:nicotinamide mononucleotide transporter [Scytonema hofmannii FACHB-248]|uniref:Nicotinamide mononucleotide transporter n=1 Tax=Scytonema hofmannii FACHB-248 TaxID=1842502 RepID=A0ABR8GN02_9CYAN|nr:MULTISPECIES: nicotinamide mononucleotide transporter [Nostocales]MBD2604800.1 nicotinamide mononucleotide transporter [Scytonema hofmannii FACHB-248]